MEGCLGRLGGLLAGHTVGNREIGTGISEASKRVPIFPFDTQAGQRPGGHSKETSLGKTDSMVGGSEASQSRGRNDAFHANGTRQLMLTK